MNPFLIANISSTMLCISCRLHRPLIFYVRSPSQAVVFQLGRCEAGRLGIFLLTGILRSFGKISLSEPLITYGISQIFSQSRNSIRTSLVRCTCVNEKSTS